MTPSPLSFVNLSSKLGLIGFSSVTCSFLAVPVLVVNIFLSNPAWAEDHIEATPYRPTVANPAELSAPGWLELEAGWIDSHGSGVSHKGLPYTAKLAFDEDWGILLGGELWAREVGVSGFGDTSLQLKHRISTSDKDQNFGFEAGFKLPTAARGLGSGKPDWIANGIYSLDFSDNWRLDLNLGGVRLGAPDPGAGRVALQWAASISSGRGPWTFAGELSGSRETGAANSLQYLGAVSYALTPKLVIDAGLSANQQSGQNTQALFFGATWLAGQVFK